MIEAKISEYRDFIPCPYYNKEHMYINGKNEDPLNQITVDICQASGKRSECPCSGSCSECEIFKERVE